MSVVIPASASARLIARPDNMKAALDAVGVRHLRDALEIQVVDREDKAGESTFASLVADRWSLLGRVLGEFDNQPYRLLHDFADRVEIRPLHRLVVIERLDLPGAPDDLAPSDRGALWVTEASALLIVEDEIRWPEVARELAVAIGIDGERAAQIAAPLMIVLKAGRPSDASDELDMLGYGDIEAAIDVHVDDVAARPPTDLPDGPVDPGPSPPKPPEVPPPGTGPQTKGPDLPTDPGNSGRTGTSPPPERTVPPRGPSGTHGDSPNAGTSKPAASHPAPRKSAPRPRLVSYVTSSEVGADANDHHEPDEKRSSTDAAAIAAVMDFERSMGRAPEEMEHSNPGFDVRSTEPDGSVRYIEVKGTSPAWDSLGVGITSRQHEEARKLGERYWLYVVVVTPDGPSEPFRIQDPASRIDRYYFDGGWRFAAEPSVASYRELAELQVFYDSDAIDSPVALLDYMTGAETGTFVPCPEECLDRFNDGLFAVRVAGETLGLLHRGGVAFAVPTSELKERNPGVIRLLDRVDPETGGVLSVRFFGEETSATGELEAAYLETDTGVPPIGIDDLATIQILGRVVYCQLPD